MHRNGGRGLAIVGAVGAVYLGSPELGEIADARLIPNQTPPTLRDTIDADNANGAGVVDDCLTQAFGRSFDPTRGIYTAFARADARPYIAAKSGEKQDRGVLVARAVGEAISKKCSERVISGIAVVTHQDYRSQNQGKVPTRNSDDVIFGSPPGPDLRRGYKLSEATILHRAVNSARYNIMATKYVTLYTGETIIVTGVKAVFAPKE